MPTPEQIQKMFAPLLPGLMGIELGETTQEKVVATMLVRPDLCTVVGRIQVKHPCLPGCCG